MAVIKGDVPFIHAFGDTIGSCEVDSKGLKSIKAEYYVMCSTYHMT